MENLKGDLKWTKKLEEKNFVNNKFLVLRASDILSNYLTPRSFTLALSLLLLNRVLYGAGGKGYQCYVPETLSPFASYISEKCYINGLYALKEQNSDDHSVENRLELPLYSIIIIIFIVCLLMFVALGYFHDRCLSNYLEAIHVISYIDSQVQSSEVKHRFIHQAGKKIIRFKLNYAILKISTILCSMIPILLIYDYRIFIERDPVEILRNVSSTHSTDVFCEYRSEEVLELHSSFRRTNLYTIQCALPDNLVLAYISPLTALILLANIFLSLLDLILVCLLSNVDVESFYRFLRAGKWRQELR